MNGKCGAMYGYHAGSLWPLQDVVDADPEADWRPLAAACKNAGRHYPARYPYVYGKLVCSEQGLCPSGSFDRDAEFIL